MTSATHSLKYLSDSLLLCGLALLLRPAR